MIENEHLLLTSGTTRLVRVGTKCSQQCLPEHCLSRRLRNISWIRYLTDELRFITTVELVFSEEILLIRGKYLFVISGIVISGVCYRGFAISRFVISRIRYFGVEGAVRGQIWFYFKLLFSKNLKKFSN